jgi:hypothetical protein
MADPKRVDDQNAKTDASAPKTPKKGGFGQFSEQYRARWAARHPDMTQRWPDGVPSELPTPPVIGDAEPDPTTEPRARDPEDPKR